MKEMWQNDPLTSPNGYFWDTKFYNSELKIRIYFKKENFLKLQFN